MIRKGRGSADPMKIPIDSKGDRLVGAFANCRRFGEKMPTYYVMDFHKGMAETVAEEMPSAEEFAACKWLTDEELAVYAAEFGRR